MKRNMSDILRIGPEQQYRGTQVILPSISPFRKQIVRTQPPSSIQPAQQLQQKHLLRYNDQTINPPNAMLSMSSYEGQTHNPFDDSQSFFAGVAQPMLSNIPSKLLNELSLTQRNPIPSKMVDPRRQRRQSSEGNYNYNSGNSITNQNTINPSASQIILPLKMNQQFTSNNNNNNNSYHLLNQDSIITSASNPRLASVQEHKGFHQPTHQQKAIAFKSLNSSPRQSISVIAGNGNNASKQILSNEVTAVVTAVAAEINNNNNAKSKKNPLGIASGLKQLLMQPKWNNSTSMHEFLNNSLTNSARLQLPKKQLNNNSSPKQKNNPLDSPENSSMLPAAFPSARQQKDQIGFASESLLEKLLSIEQEYSYTKISQYNYHNQSGNSLQSHQLLMQQQRQVIVQPQPIAHPQSIPNQQQSFSASQHGEHPPRKHLMEMSSQLSELTQQLLKQQLNISEFYTAFEQRFTTIVHEISRQISNDCFERGQLLEKLFFTVLAIAEELVTKATSEFKRCETDKLSELKRMQITFKHRLESDAAQLEKLSAAGIAKDNMIKNLYVQCESYKRSAQQAEMHRSLLTNEFDSLRYRIEALLSENTQLKVKIDEVQALNSVFLRDPCISINAEMKTIVKELNLKRDHHFMQQKIVTTEVEEAKSNFREASLAVEKTVRDSALNPRNLKTRDMTGVALAGDGNTYELDDIFTPIETVEVGTCTSDHAAIQIDQETGTEDLIEKTHRGIMAKVLQIDSETQETIPMQDFSAQVDIKRALRVSANGGSNSEGLPADASLEELMAHDGWDRVVAFPIDMPVNLSNFGYVRDSVRDSCEYWSAKNDRLGDCISNKDEFTADDFYFIRTYMDQHVRFAEEYMYKCLERIKAAKEERNASELTSIDRQLDIVISQENCRYLEAVLAKLLPRLKEVATENTRIIQEQEDLKKQQSSQNLVQSAAQQFMRNNRRSAGNLTTTTAITTQSSQSNTVIGSTLPTASTTTMIPTTASSSTSENQLRSNTQKIIEMNRRGRNSVVSMHVQSNSPANNSNQTTNEKPSMLKKLVQSAINLNKQTPSTLQAEQLPSKRVEEQQQQSGRRKSQDENEMNQQFGGLSPTRKKLSKILEDDIESEKRAKGDDSPSSQSSIEESIDRDNSPAKNHHRTSLDMSASAGQSQRASLSPSPSQSHRKLSSGSHSEESIERKSNVAAVVAVGGAMSGMQLPPSGVAIPSEANTISEVVKMIDATVNVVQPTTNVFSLMRIHLAQSTFAETATVSLVKALKLMQQSLKNAGNTAGNPATGGAGNSINPTVAVPTIVFSKLPQILKIIQAVIIDIAKAQGLIQINKRGDSNANQPAEIYHFHIYLYEHIVNLYGTGHMAAKKFTQMVHGILSNKKNPRMKTLGKFLTGEYDLADFKFFVRLLFQILPSDLAYLEEKLLVTSVRATESLNIFFLQQSVDSKAILSIEKQLATTAKVKGISKTTYVYDLDVFVSVLMDAHIREVKAQKKVDYVDLWYSMDSEKQDVIDVISFGWLMKHFCVPIDSASALELYFAECDKTMFGDARLSFDRFVNLCAFKGLLTMEQQEQFWQTYQEQQAEEAVWMEQMIGGESAQSSNAGGTKNWSNEQLQIKLRFIKSKGFDKRRKRMLNEIDAFNANPKKARHSQKTIEYMQAFLVKESQAVMVDSCLDSLVPTQFNLITNATVALVKKKVAKQNHH